jgi:hemoglobin
MVEGFYARVLKDEQLAPIFLDVARIDINKHLPRICSFYEKMLFGMPGYSRHMMNLHRDVHAAHPLKSEHFARWLELFEANVDALYSGKNVQRVKRLVHTIANNMQNALGVRCEHVDAGKHP